MAILADANNSPFGILRVSGSFFWVLRQRRERLRRVPLDSAQLDQV